MMKRRIWIVFNMLFALQTLYAQSIPAHDTANRIVSLGYTSDAFAGMALGYAQSPSILPEKDLQVYTRFSFPLLLAAKNRSFDSWEVALGANAGLFTTGKFGTIADIRVFLLHHNQVLGTFMPLGINLRLTPAYYFSGGYLGFQINWNQTIAAHISHSQYVKNTFSDLYSVNKKLMDFRPEDGWYGRTGSHVSIGIEGSRAMGSRYLLYGDLGTIKFSSPYTGIFDAMMMGQVPFFANVRLYYKM